VAPQDQFHVRIFLGGQALRQRARQRAHEDMYLASADWMERNFFRRIELCVPVLDRRLKGAKGA
jgi:polyphosphate kinase